MTDHEGSAKAVEKQQEGDETTQGDDGQGTPSRGPATGRGGRSMAARSENSRDIADRDQRPIGAD